LCELFVMGKESTSMLWVKKVQAPKYGCNTWMTHSHTISRTDISITHTHTLTHTHTHTHTRTHTHMHTHTHTCTHMHTHTCTHTHAHTHFALQIELLRQHNASVQREYRAKNSDYEAEVQRLSSEVRTKYVALQNIRL